ncbi:spore protease YyaC [Bacillus carboniphilus]|uniref:Spore protease YyaC n=1 Tax=Bacillus carboniphilus TaxID=86663 RepID=A0ABN0WEJ0_9BACI
MKLKPQFFDRSSGNVRIPYDDEHAVQSLASRIQQLIPTTTQPIVFICIGTDRSTGDSLGPFIGTLLKEKPTTPFFIYGTLDDPIHAVNLMDKLNMIQNEHKNPYIIGIDACLGRIKSVGHIILGEGPVKPGAGVNKDLPHVGDAHITGIVNVSGFMEFFVLQNTRLNLVVSMAKTVANGIYEAGIQFQRRIELNNFNPLDQEQSL